MTKSCSSKLADREKELKVKNIGASAYYSKRDKCWTTMVRCSKCAKPYEEGLNKASDLVELDMPFLCLMCDPDAESISFVGVTIRFDF